MSVFGDMVCNSNEQNSCFAFYCCSCRSLQALFSEIPENTISLQLSWSVLNVVHEVLQTFTAVKKWKPRCTEVPWVPRGPHGQLCDGEVGLLPGMQFKGSIQSTRSTSEASEEG